MSADKVEFKMLDYKRLGDEVVTFELEDGAIVKVKVDLGRVGKAIKNANPDGTPHYAINTSVMTSVIPPNNKNVQNVALAQRKRQEQNVREQPNVPLAVNLLEKLSASRFNNSIINHVGD